ncbi:FliH/SctL family protein [Roseibium aestuarii]|uniref:FliH/SctL family protein n=1 Tax=Roseibium aestuarii TaxID=2600299 RepID=A0ABW4JXL9_9HYPH|nr:FliH/SctL family protein [Roseibium aestuarii]
MTSPSKFLFDTDFTAPEVPVVEAPVEPEVPMMPVADHEAALATARKIAFEEGRAAAAKELATSQDQRLTNAVYDLVAMSGQVVAAAEAEQASQEQDAIGLAFMIARRLCAHLLARQPLAETVALFSECLGPLRKSPHLVVRIAPQDVEALKAKVDPIVAEKGFEGKLVILGAAEVARGDCRIEWGEGGIIRDRKALEKQIDASIKAYLQARGQGRTQAAAETAPAGADQEDKA